MQFFLDSAMTEEIQYALDMWDIDGVTTNPRHVQVSGKPFMTAIREIGAIFAGTEKTVSVQTNPHKHDDYQAIVAEGRKLAALSPNFVIKMPCTEHGYKACKILSEDGIRVNLTLCFSAAQALQAMRVGAFYVSPFIGWKESNAEEVGTFIEEIVAIRGNYAFDTQVLVAAIRNGRQLVDAAVMGADITTAGFAVYQEAFAHPYTDVGLKKFQDFWDQTAYE
ncbi:MAG: transaldolase [Anaerolineaceae bacterium]|nr:transaldolase [Anaerolineaceae bacterium]